MANPTSDPNSAADQASAANINRMEDLAHQQVEDQGGVGKPSLLDYLDEQSALLQSATQHFRETPEKESLSYAAEWMLDNFYLVQQALRQILEDMPPGFYRQLPKLAAGPLAGYPRVYAVAQELVVIQTAHLDLDRGKRFIQLYQDITPLTMGELWALPIMLRLSSIECLAQAITRITAVVPNGPVRQNALPTMALPRELTDDEIVANCIISLRTLATQDWQEFFESVSRVEQVLRGEPTGIYARMDQETRDSYRKVIEDLARFTGRSEQEVAREAVSLAAEFQASTQRTAHVGYYLADAGRAQLETRLGYHPAWRERLRRWVFRHPTPVYLGSIALISLVILLGGICYAMNAGATPWQWIGAGLLLLIPAVTISVGLVNWIVTRAVPPRVLPKMDFRDGIPAEYRTIVVVPAMLTNAAEVESLVHQLEMHYLRDQDPHLCFALLTDLPDASQLRTAGEHPLVEQAEAGIRRLNEKYHRETPGSFYLFHRDPKWNPREERWMGWERKRGKLHELNLLLRGHGDTAFSVQTGDVQVLRGIKYVITLDADTIMPRGAARRLVATLAHPLNHAEFGPRGVVAGYTLLQPGIEITSTSANLSRFTRVFAGDVGLDLYTRAVSNAYQDLFGEGIYVGKGIYDLDAFERSLAGRMPENALLSHDLIEGIHGRVGLVTDIVLYEEYPPHYFVYLRRSRRWIRGDWQLLPWLLPWVPSVGKKATLRANTLSVIARWKILDNLRRSLLSPALFVLFVAAWLWLPGSPLVWTLAGLLTPAVPVLTAMVVGSIHRYTQRGVNTQSWQNALRPIQNGVVRWMLALVFLPYETLVTLGGIVTTLLRLLVTRRNLLQWTTYADTVRLFAGEMTWQQRLTTMLVAAALALLTLCFNPTALFVAAPLLIAWLLSPQIAYWISRPIRHTPDPLSTEHRQVLRDLARRTWLFFERFVGPEDHWLPPDHFQESPRGVITPSTSPTNIGVLLLSTLAAYDLGYIESFDLVTRLRATFESMEKLERYRGHFLNWYDTRDLAPLPPRYVSTVDSGNLAACLRTLGQGCLALLHAPLLRWQSWEGLLDTLGLLDDVIVMIAQDLEPTGPQPAVAPLKNWLERTRQHVLAVKHDPDAWSPLLNELTGPGQIELDRLLMSLVESCARDMDAETLRRLRISTHRVKSHLESTHNKIELMLPWLLMMGQPPRLFTQPDSPPAIREAWQALRDALPTLVTLEHLPEVYKAGQACLALLTRLSMAHQLDPPRPEHVPEEWLEEARDWCQQLTRKLELAPMTARVLAIGLQDLDQQAENYFQAMDFGFLFDSHRQMFHLGYNVDTGKLDSNYYDLLASEARIASVVAIAKNDVPPSHWLHLNRPLTQLDSTQALLSWSATMFEYLMPTLLIKSYAGTLLQHSCRAAVDYQIKYAKQKGVPWGISESGFYAFDASLNYQYRAFGVPGLGFKRNLARDLVVAPYASLMALPLQPREVMENIARLTELNMLGTHGFYEAVDFTPSRLALGEKYAIVRSYMAHHQGMVMLSLVNYLHGDVMVSRFHSDPRIQSIELLLQEKMPTDAPLELAHPEDSQAVRRVQAQIATHPWSVPVEVPVPQVHYLSNGRYGVLLTSAGSGFSRWQETELTRWRADTTLDNWGTWIYVRDLDSGDLWSATYQPTAVAPASQSVQFYAHMAEFRRSDHGFDLHLQVVVAPDDDVEIRRVSLTNHSDRVRRLALTSYGEVILAPQSADQRHPAFNKLFIESEYLPGTALGTTALSTTALSTTALLFRRRPRSEQEEPIYLAHALVVQPSRVGHNANPPGACETDRARFLGRGHTPRALGMNATLDPIMSLSQDIELEAHETVQVTFVTLAARSRQEALALCRRYQTSRAIHQAFNRARSRAELDLHQLGLATTDLERIQQLLSALVYPHAALRADPAVLAANRQGQSGLWGWGISGDYPILLVRINNSEELGLINQVLQAHTYWRDRQLKIDLVILDMQDTGYGQELRGQLQRLLVRTHNDSWLNRRGGIFILNADQMNESDRVLLGTAARVVLDGSKGILAEQLEALHRRPTRLPPFAATKSRDVEPTPALARPAGLLFDNGLGGLTGDGREYVIYLEPEQRTPTPWINVIANPTFGFLVSEAGSSSTWSVNSSENRLTPWSNDPVTDPPGEALYLRDEETAQVWSPTPQPARAPAPYLVRHGAGYSIFEHHSHGLEQELRLFVAPDAPVKVIQLRLKNVWARDRRITATFYTEWVLGVVRDASQQYVVSEFDNDSQALLARNPYNAEFGERVAFVAASKKLHGLTADRAEFLGRMGSFSHPAALERIGLASTVQPGLDPCAAVQLHIDLGPGEVQEIFFLLGEAASKAEALRLVKHYQNAEQVKVAWESASGFWEDVLGSVQVQTPDPAMNILLNRWLLYQALACRVWGRAAFYQASGAFGFRDQLQDVMALLHVAPHLAREHILESARQQFEAGDVLHWWHPPSGRGVRTRCSDDLLWLPFVTAHYVEATGDESILDEQSPFRKAAPLGMGEDERYGQYPPTGEIYTLYEHCRRALEKGSTAGPHSLPLMGSGDWNDGMNRVGRGVVSNAGKGESVWLGWFLCATLKRWASLCERRGEKTRASAYWQRADELREAIEANAWDGEWYLRAFYDDGTPLGSAENLECQIDSIAQSWAVLSGAGDPARAAQAMQSVVKRLVKGGDTPRLVLLFTPPFDKTPRDPGYIKGYAPGIRENGGQYTHAAVWVAWALAELGEGDQAEALFRLLNPLYHGDTPEEVARYKVEPYVIAADVYSQPPHAGRGGWTWYTGSAAWMYRLGLEAILGIRRVGQALQINPCIPKSWTSYQVIYRNGATAFQIKVENPSGVNRGVRQVALDGKALPGNEIPLLRDGGQHQVHVLMG